MQTIELTPVEKDILRAVLDTFPDGVTISTMRQALKIFDKIDLCEALLYLEDAEVAFIQTRFAAAKFIKVDRNIVSLFDKFHPVNN